MSTHLHVTSAEYARMVELGAFDHLNRKIELIRGEIREMNPAGPLHNDLIIYLDRWSHQTVDCNLVYVGIQVSVDFPLLDSCPEPDLLWLRAARYRERHPTATDVYLAIEVADSSLQSDLTEKSALYAEAGIVEYWIVDARGKCVHVFREPRDGVYRQQRIAKVGETLLPIEPCTKPLDLRDMFE